MSEGGVSFNRGAVRPVECLKAGWQLIREDYWLFFGITLVGMLVGNLVPFGILVGPMMCGIYLCLLRREGGGRVTFEMLFEGFNYFAQSLIATLLMVVPVLLLVGVFYGLFIAGMVAAGISMAGDTQGGGTPDATIPVVVLVLYLVALLVLLVVATVVGALFMFTFLLIVDRGLSGPQALLTSARAVFANFGGVVGLMLLATLLSLLGVLACYVGAYFFMPIHMAAVAVAYRRVFPADGSVLFLPPPEWPAPSALEPRSARPDFRHTHESPVTDAPPPPSEPGIQRHDEAPGGA